MERAQFCEKAEAVILIGDGQDRCVADVVDGANARLVVAADDDAALRALRQPDAALVILAWERGDGPAPDCVRSVCAAATARQIPVLALAASSDCAEELYRSGATDVLAAPFTGALLRHKIERLLATWRQSVALAQSKRAEQEVREQLAKVIDDAALAARSVEEQLRASRERYQALFESVDDGLCIVEMVFDTEGRPVDYRFLEVNAAFVQHTGLVDAVGKRVREMVPEHDEHWFANYGRVAQTGEPMRFVDEAKALGRWYDVFATRVGAAGSNKVAILFRDITDRTLADERLRRLADDLAEADRRKNIFLATLAHELRNPLAALRNAVQLMRRASADTGQQERAQQVMERQLTLLVHLVDDLLDVARITHGQIELKKARVDVRDIVADVVDTSAPLIDAGRHAFCVDLPPQALLLEVDPIRITQALGNLLNNAAKYTPAGGRIGLSVRREGSEVVLAVSDTGVGIAPQSLGQVFDMFAQIRDSGDLAQGGLGIGLSLVRELVTLHGGDVTVASAGVGKGSTFSIRLPVPDAAGERTTLRPTVRATGAKALQGPRRILIVDDNRDAADTLAALLEQMGQQSRVANDGEQALRMVAAFQPELAFLDIGMPGMNGYQLARAIRTIALPKPPRLVALTGWGGDADREQSWRAGFDMHLTKPVMIEAIEALLLEMA
jgi:PAS domain S-box-containing protein